MLPFRFGESAQNPYWVIVSLNSSGLNYVLMSTETLTHNIEKLINSGHCHYQCVCQITEQSIQDIGFRIITNTKINEKIRIHIWRFFRDDILYEMMLVPF